MKTYLIVITIITILLSACCPTISVNPLSNPSGLDKRLEGLWKSDFEEDETVYLHIAEKSENIMEVLSVEHKENGTLDAAKIPFYVTKTTKNNYLNVKIEDIENENNEGYKGYVFLKYVFINRDTLNLFLMYDDPIVSAIQQNKLKGEITIEKTVANVGAKSSESEVDVIDCVKITESSSNILNYIDAGNHDVLFPDAMKFIRIK